MPTSCCPRHVRLYLHLNSCISPDEKSPFARALLGHQRDPLNRGQRHCWAGQDPASEASSRARTRAVDFSGNRPRPSSRLAENSARARARDALSCGCRSHTPTGRLRQRGLYAGSHAAGTRMRRRLQALWRGATSPRRTASMLRHSRAAGDRRPGNGGVPCRRPGGPPSSEVGWQRGTPK